MKTIIAGSRYIKDQALITSYIEQAPWEITEVVCGGARGVDMAGKHWAELRSIPVKMFLPNWAKFGPRAGFIRNTEMADYADAVLTVWDGKSRGTLHMQRQALKRIMPLVVFRAEGSA